MLDPLALSDAVPLAVNQALQLTKRGPGALDASASLGVLNTLVLLLIIIIRGFRNCAGHSKTC